MVAPPAGEAIIWGLSAGSLIALTGVAVNLGWNAFNSYSTSRVRRNATRLEFFNAHARRPLEPALTAIEEIFDAAEDLQVSASPLDERKSSLEDLRRKFTGASRLLGRRLMDLQHSELVDGHDWAALIDLADPATDAFDHARTALDDATLNGHLGQITTTLSALRRRVRARLDDESNRLMK